MATTFSVLNCDQYITMTPKNPEDADTPQVKYLLRKADGTEMESDEEPTGGYNANDRLRLMKTTQDAIHSGSMKLKWGDEGGETENFDDEARAYMLDGFDTDFYSDLFKNEKGRMINGDVSGARGIIYQLAVCWFVEQRRQHRLRFGKYGGMWSCGQFSGVWTDFLLQIKCREGFVAPYYYIGVRITTELEIPFNNPLKWKPTFNISRIDFFKTAPAHGLTTVLFPNYGRPFCSEIEKSVLTKKKEAELARKKEEKRIREEAVRHAERLKAMVMMAEAEERRQQREMEASLDETIIAYNAQVKRVKDLITFNREKVAVPLSKRIEAKEAERQREEAERRHAEKLKQKEMERLAKHAPAFKTKSK
jgi:hypothetical protein